MQGKLLQREADEEEEIQKQPEEEEETAQAKGDGGSSTVSSAVESDINSLRGDGQPLPVSTRAFFEPRFSADFSGVRVNTDSKAAETAKSINAKAFTKGRNIVFDEGQYSPENSSGKQLLAHELTHVIQQKISNSAIKNTLQRKWKRKKGKAHVWIAGSNRDTYSGLLWSKYRQPKSFYQCLRPIKVKEEGVFGMDVFKGDMFDASLLSRKNAVSLALKGVFDRDVENYWPDKWYGAKLSIAPDDDIRKPSKKGQAIMNLVFTGHEWSRSQIGKFKISSAKDPGASYQNAKARKFPNKCLFARRAKAWFVGCQTSNFAKAFAKKYMRKGSSSMGIKSDIFVEATIYKAHPADPFGITTYTYKVRFVRGYNSVTNTYKSPLSKPLTKSKFHSSGYWSKYWGKR